MNVVTESAWPWVAVVRGTAAALVGMFLVVAVLFWPLEPADPVEGPDGYLPCGGALPVLLGHEPPGGYDDMILNWHSGIEPAVSVSGDAEAICRSAAVRRLIVAAVVTALVGAVASATARLLTRRPPSGV